MKHKIADYTMWLKKDLPFPFLEGKSFLAKKQKNIEFLCKIALELLGFIKMTAKGKKYGTNPLAGMNPSKF